MAFGNGTRLAAPESMPRRHFLAVIVGSLALVPLGIAGATIALRTIVDPVTEAMPGSLLAAVQDLAGGESGCGSRSSIFSGGTKHPAAKAFLDRNATGERGRRNIEHLYIDAAAESQRGRESPDHVY